MMQFILIFGILIFAFIEAIVGQNSTGIDWLRAGNCKNIWRDAKLIGKCFGLRPYQKFAPQLESVTVKSAADCRAVCCNLGEACVTWQYYYNPRATKNGECRLTNKIVRLGLEKTGTPDWCDPYPPSKWNGKRLKSRNADGTCEWGEELPFQCFGLGDEKKSADGKPLNTLDCAKACCDNKLCDMWQEVPGRGCFYSKDIGKCMGKAGIYDGGRKCVPGFCDGKEAQLLH